jgi:RHS repeat-associated protein
MNAANLNAPPDNACALDVQSGAGPDRVTRNTYDAAGQLTKVENGVGTSDAVLFERYAYSLNGKRTSLQDGAINPSDPAQKSNLTTFVYDGFDRLFQQFFPVTTRGSNQSDTANFEQYGYDLNGNRTSFRHRDGNTVTYGYDSLNRVISKSGGGLKAVTYSYDLRDRLKQALYTGTNGKAVTYTYDKAGRKTVENTYDWQVQYQYDEAGNLTRLTWPDSVYTAYAYDNANRLTTVTQSDGRQLASLTYDTLGRRSTLTRPNSTSTTYTYDNASRLSDLLHSMTAAGQLGDHETMGFNPAGQVASLTHFDPFVWKGQPATATNDTHDGLNRLARITAIGGYDAKGNLTNDGVRTYTYDVENRLTGIPTGPVTTIEAYDPLGRIRARNTSATGVNTFMLMEGDHLIAQYSNNGLLSAGGNPAIAPLRRYVFIPGQDEPLVWYEGTTPSWLHPDREGSIIAWSDASGVVVNAGAGINRTATYGPYGEPSTWNMPGFGYTGQAVYSESQLYYYKARIYSPALGRFLQTDPVGYDAGDTNLYAYVRDDPENKTDPSGQWPSWSDITDALDQIGEVLNANPEIGGPVEAVPVRMLERGAEAISAAREARAVQLEAATARAADRAAMRGAGIPTSQQAVRQGQTAAGRFRIYETPKAGGGRASKAVVHSSLDRSRVGETHVEAGSVKTDPRTGELRMNRYGAPRLGSDKTKVDVRPDAGG